MKNRFRLKVDTNCKVSKVIEKPKLERCNSNRNLSKTKITPTHRISVINIKKK